MDGKFTRSTCKCNVCAEMNDERGSLVVRTPLQKNMKDIIRVIKENVGKSVDS
jgi:hypothetical protein